MVVSLKNLREMLMDRIDTNDMVQVDKVDRYIELTKSFRKMNTIIRKEGESLTTVNAAQEFTKAHPLIAERNRVNSSLLSIEKSFPDKDPDKDKPPNATDLI